MYVNVRRHQNNIRAFISGRFTLQHSRLDCVENLPFQSLSETQFKRGQTRFLLPSIVRRTKSTGRIEQDEGRGSPIHTALRFPSFPPPSFSPPIYLSLSLSLYRRCPSSLGEISTDWFRRPAPWQMRCCVVRNTESSSSGPEKKSQRRKKKKAVREVPYK